MSSMEEATTAEEELCMDRQYPWHCHSDGLRTFKQYKTKAEMAHDVGVTEEQIANAIQHNKGNLGAYHFVQR